MGTRAAAQQPSPADLWGTNQQSTSWYDDSLVDQRPDLPTAEALETPNRIGSLPLCENEHLQRWIAETAGLTMPAAIHWVDGSEEEYDRLCAQMVASGTLIKLNQDLLPGCYYARSDADDVARVEDRISVARFRRKHARVEMDHRSRPWPRARKRLPSDGSRSMRMLTGVASNIPRRNSTVFRPSIAPRGARK
jgi:phosphoenolpyruvate carboxykinase-like protein